MPKELTEKQLKKKEYNRQYLEKLKSKAKEEALTAIQGLGKHEQTEILLKSDNDDGFFFQDKKPTTATTKPAKREPVPVVIQQPPTATLKHKIIETSALTAISMLPMLIKMLVSWKLSNQSSETKQQNIQQTHANTSSHYSADMNLLL